MSELLYLVSESSTYPSSEAPTSRDQTPITFFASKMCFTCLHPCAALSARQFETVASTGFGAKENSNGSMYDASGKPVAYFSPNSERLCLRLSGPPLGPRLGPSKFEPDKAYWLRVTWPDSERARWEARGQQTEADTKKHQWIGQQPYNAEEKQWLKKHYEGEFKFLIAHGLSIYKKEDRAEGRAIMRMLARNGKGYVYRRSGHRRGRRRRGYRRSSR